MKRSAFFFDDPMILEREKSNQSKEQEKRKESQVEEDTVRMRQSYVKGPRDDSRCCSRPAPRLLPEKKKRNTAEKQATREGGAIFAAGWLLLLLLGLHSAFSVSALLSRTSKCSQ